MADLSRREWLEQTGAGCAGAAITGAIASRAPKAWALQNSTPADGTISPHSSTTGVFVPPRGRSFQKFSFDFPEPSVAFAGFEFGFRIFTHENVYGLSASQLRVRRIGDDALEITCSELVWAGGQEGAAGRLTARLTPRGNSGQCDG